ncbi:hypothetical protein HA402_003215 [Bradysia odoriphaga]|nr:hypothetical protein HA402_009378 [Bradysia odoriphaga]KAG4069774.1 hypothetical protein HA402_003215 [Bradysia odoriphaga]
MFPSYFITISLILASAAAQNYHNGDTQNSLDSKGVCTINGQTYRGIDCWCYSNQVGTVFFITLTVAFVVFFFISGCCWACIFRCYKSIRGTRDDDFRSISGSRASLRSRSGFRKGDIEI